MQILDEGENPLLHGGVHLPGGEIVEDAPLEPAAVHGALAELHLIREDALIRQAEHGRLLGAEIVRVVQIVDEHEIGHLLDHVQRVRETTGPEDLPEAVDFVFQFACNHVPYSFSQFQT